MIEWYLLAIIIGAIIGSFLNVVIYRYPLMLKAQWRAECVELLELTDASDTPPKLSLSFPRSHCPTCKKQLPFYCNIPIFSYLFLLGKCHACKSKIPFRYLLVELISAVASFIVVFYFGLSVQTIALLILTWAVIALAFIDIKHYLLPDTITLSLLWIGLFCATQQLFASPINAILGALLGYLFLWIIATAYKYIKKQDGMGYGDCKMLAMFGAWLGPIPLLNVILLSSLVALFISMLFICFKKLKRDQLIPFGPYLALAGWWTLIFGPQLSNTLMRFMQ